MKQRKTFRSVLSMVLAMIMIVSLPIAAFADGEPVVEGPVDNGDGTSTVTTTTTTSTTDAGSGTVTVEVIVHENTSTNDPSAPTQMTEDITTTTTTVKDSDDNVLSTKEVEEGSRVTSGSNPDKGTEPGQPEVTVELDPDKPTSNSAATTTVTGDVQQGPGDGHYSYTETTETERTVEASAEVGDIVIDTSGEGDFNPIQTDRNMVNEEGSQLHTRYNTSYYLAMGLNDKTEGTKPEEGGYDFLYYGFGQMSGFYVGLENAEGVESHSGALQFELMQDPEIVQNEDGSYSFANDAAKDRFTAYCCDCDTGAVAGYWYKLDNLEDATYYDEDSAANIRAIATNGYWGTEAGDDSQNPATGSLEKLKLDLKANLDKVGLTEEEIDAITPGQALAATQAAIWSFANSETTGDKVDFLPDENDDGRLVITGYKAWFSPTDDDYAKTEAIFNYLRNLSPADASESTQIIDADSFIKEDSMSITVGDMIAEAAASQDDADDNDVYDVAINFALVVTPSDDKDDLVVQVVALDADGNEYIAAQGRIAGDSSADVDFNKVEYNKDTGEYSLKNLQLAENSDFSFDLKLTGTQHLQEGVYIFTSEIKNNTPSQSFVGMAEGDKQVSASQSFVINFDVDENNHYTVVENWRNDPENNYNPPEENDPPEWDPPVPMNDEPEDEEEIIVIEEEPVPLAQAPSTGSVSAVFAVAAAVSGMGLAGLAISAKHKGEDEE